MSTYPDPVLAICDLLERPGSPATPGTFLPADEYGAVAGPFPFAHVRHAGVGTESYIDRTDDVTIDIYTHLSPARPVGEAIRAFITGEQIDTGEGFIDDISVVLTPSEVAWQSETVAKATMKVSVTARPLFD